MAHEARSARHLGLASVLSGIGIVLGAGIYFLIGEAAGLPGSGVRAGFLVSALLTTAAGLSYTELTSMFAEAGAAAYARAQVGNFAVFTLPRAVEP